MSWKVDCKPTYNEALGILHLPMLNEALLSKWMSCIMTAEGEMMVKVLKDRYEIGLDWDREAASIRGVFAFWQGVKRVSLRFEISLLQAGGWFVFLLLA